MVWDGPVKMSHSNAHSLRVMTKPNVATQSATERCAREVVETVPLVMRFIRTEMRRQSGPFLSVPQLRTLLFLSRCPGADLSSAADHLGVSRPTASAIVNRLVHQGLVNRTGHPEKRRFIILTLTRTGFQRLQRAREAACALVASVLAHRPSAELRKVMEGIALLGKVFKEVIDSDGFKRGQSP
jgi:DNA-binding MarR family transcriptional regulator